MSDTESVEYVSALREALSEIESFASFTASGRQRGFEPVWEKVTIRPVELKGRRHYQVSYFDGKQDITKNHLPDQFSDPLDQILTVGFANFHVQSENGDLHIRITKKGKALISRGRPSLQRERRHLEHNRPKSYLLTPEEGRDVLDAVGILDQDGRVKPTMQAKFRQVNGFLQLMNDKLESQQAGPLHIVDCGCGSAFLTFAAYAYLSSVRKQDVTLTGIDQSESLIAKCQDLASRLGWDRVSFETTRIADYEPTTRPDVVLSLHACDTATDEALAQAVNWGAKVILAAPCCQQELAGQVKSDVHRPVLRHGILKQRTADILTDGIRAQLLQIAGYRSDVVEFISCEETSKNLMIRAEKGRTGDVRSSCTGIPGVEDLLGDLTQP
jgi:SAM-dependent methyltransferase